MKTSKIKNRTNLSNEFTSNALGDNVKYNVALKDLSEINKQTFDIAERFQNKERVIKEKSSLGGFRIPQENLKKRTKHVVPEFENNYKNSFSFNPYTQKHQQEDFETLVDENADLSGNLIHVLDREVEKLKRESEEHLKAMEQQRLPKQSNSYSNTYSLVEEKKENKVYTQYLASSPDRVQAIKHVATQFKPEYMSLEELQKLKEEHMKKLVQLENEFYDKKRKGDNLIQSRVKYEHTLEKEMKLKNESKKITPEQIESILKQEQEFLNREENKIKPLKIRARSARGIKREDNDKPIGKNEKKYIRKYMNYLAKKDPQYGDDETDTFNNSRDWNKTKVKSFNANGTIDRTDGLPGHLDREDYSMYYYSISSHASPRSHSEKSIRKKGKKQSRLNKSYDNTIRTANKGRESEIRTYTNENYQYREESNQAGNNINSHIAFIKLIFSLIDKDNKGYILKQDFLKDMKLEDQILSDLGFESDVEFIDLLQKFQTDEEGYLAEHELIAFLLSRSQLGEVYLQDMKNHYNMEEEVNTGANNNYYVEHNKDEIIDDEDMDDPEIRMNHYDFLKSQNTEDRLQKVKESLSKSRDHYSKKNDNLKNSFIKNVIKPNNKDIFKVRVAYKDYANFLTKYKSKSELNFTIPKPFDFLKRDNTSKKLKKIEEILEERKRKEDEILGYRFRPNELKREIFINNYENVIEGEKEKRRYRTEILKEKILQEMKPFSFYELDEKKFKDKTMRECQAPQFLPFKANPIPWTSQVNMYDDIIKKANLNRQMRVEERAMQTLKTAKLPPRMQIHEEKKRVQDDEKKHLEKSATKRSKSFFKAKSIPDFQRAHESFSKNLEKKKAVAKPTEPVPFNFHEPKVISY